MKVFILLVTLINLSQASRILFLFPTPSKSHLVITHALSTTLAEKGHDVTVFSPFPMEKQIKNHREFKSPYSADMKVKMDEFASGSTSKLQMVLQFPKLGIKMAEDMVYSADFQRILKEDFDLIIIGLTSGKFLLGFGEHFNCPTAILSVQRHSSHTNNPVGNPVETNAVAHAFFSSGSLGTFEQRLKNFLINTADMLIFEVIGYHDKITYDKVFPQPRYRAYEKSARNVSLVLVNEHFGEGTVRPNVPAVVEIRGIQVKPTPDELPKDIKEFLDGAKDGSIFFSLGTNVRTEHFSENAIKILMKVFGKLKQRVIMKWDAEKIDDQPDNVMLGKWLPQDDILAHPSMKLFISHCGLGGVVESKYHAVPILGLPIFGDQLLNCEEIESEGWSLVLDLKTMTESVFAEAMNQLIYNETYSATVKKLSHLYRDRPMTPRENAVYWIEYVIRHHGAPHMQYLAVHQNFWQRTSLDVIGFLAVIIVISLKLLKFIVKRIVRELCARRKTAVTAGEKKIK